MTHRVQYCTAAFFNLILNLLSWQQPYGLSPGYAGDTFVMRVSTPTEVSMLFSDIFLLSGRWHGVDEEEAASEQSVSVAVSRILTSKADSLTQMAHPCNLCGPI